MSLTDHPSNQYISVCIGMKKSMSVHFHGEFISAREPVSRMEGHQKNMLKVDRTCRWYWHLKEWCKKRRPCKSHGKELPNHAGPLSEKTSFHPWYHGEGYFLYTVRDKTNGQRGYTWCHPSLLLGWTLLFAEIKLLLLSIKLDEPLLKSNMK